MTLVIDLPPEVERRLEEEAAWSGQAPAEYVQAMVVEKLGFREEGLRRRYLHIDGSWRDHLCYALTVEDVRGGLLARWRGTLSAQRSRTGPCVVAFFEFQANHLGTPAGMLAPRLTDVLHQLGSRGRRLVLATVEIAGNRPGGTYWAVADASGSDWQSATLAITIYSLPVLPS